MPSFRKASNNNDLWQFREAAPVDPTKKVILIVLFIAGCVSILHLADWWFRAEHVASLPLFLVLSLIFWWGMTRMVILWVNYLKISKPQKKEAKTGLTVAIFTTS